MTLTQITFFFFGILAIIVIAMWVHAYLDRRTIRKHLERLAAQFPGTIVQESSQYPAFHSHNEGRPFTLLFNEVKVGKQNILYAIYSITAALPHSLLLIKKGAYKPIEDVSSFDKVNGAILQDIETPFEARSLSPEWAARAYREGIQPLLNDLGSFLSLQCGPDALVVGKPFEGVEEVDPKIILNTVTALTKLANGLEQVPS